MDDESMFCNPQANTLSLSSSEVYLLPREAGEREEMRGRERGETTGTPSSKHRMQRTSLLTNDPILSINSDRCISSIC